MFLSWKNKTRYLKTVISYFIKLLPQSITLGQINYPDLVLKTTIFQYQNLLYILKNHTLTKAQTLNDICVTDYPENTGKRFLISYVCSSLRYNTRYIISLWTNSYTSLYSISSIYKNSLWLEREVWDFFGIFFQKHTDLRRILTDYGFQGYPLRKDFPLVGFLELYYDFKKKKLNYKKSEFFQEYRNFIGV